MQCVATLAREVNISALLFKCIIPADIPTVVCNSISSHHAPEQNEVEHQNDEKEVEVMSPGEKQYTPPDSNISEDTSLVDGQSKPSIGKQHRPYHLLFHDDSTRHAN